jgi:membrane protease YdiL (CAAX protease family)
MPLPGTPSLVFLGYLLGYLPWAALRSARRLRGAATALPPRIAIWTGTLVSQGILLLIAWFAGRSFGYQPFAAPALGWRAILATAGALAVSFVLRALGRRLRNSEERRQALVFAIAPRTPTEWALWLATVLVASVAEELAYRGVAMNILWYTLGSPWPAVLLSALAFAAAHAVQGRKSALVIFGLALVAHALVALTGTLVTAMVVHAVHDLVAGTAIAREARAGGVKAPGGGA